MTAIKSVVSERTRKRHAKLTAERTEIAIDYKRLWRLVNGVEPPLAPEKRAAIAAACRRKVAR